jgi:MFS family permease
MPIQAEETAAMGSESARDPARSLAYAWFVVAVLMVAYVFSFIDRQILNLLVGPIRKDLGISDTQMSLLMGFSFAIFYTICGIPLGRIADSRSRRGLVAAGVVVWSAMTAACGLTRHYWQLFLCRIGVGVGEAALSPAAYSMIADYFPRELRATALSVYSMGIYLGSGMAFLLGGLVVKFASAQGVIELPLIGATRPWQVVFFIVGGAGVLFSLCFLMIREPVRQGAHAGVAVPLRKVLAYLNLNRRTVLCHNLGFALLAFASYGASAWTPTFFVRTYDWDMGTVGVVYGSVVMVFGASGIVFGGRLADWLLRRGYPDATLRVGMWGAIACIPFGTLYPLMPTPELAVIMLIPTVFCLSMPFGVAPAAIQEIMPNAMRGQASAVYLFIVNLIGLGTGPTAVALFTDYVFHDDNAVRYSLLIVGAAAQLVAIALLASGLRPYRESLARVQQLARI